MVRTTIHLTEEARRGLRALAIRTGRSRSELIREAIDALLARQEADDRISLLKKGRGLWSRRRDLPSSSELRHELDRKQLRESR